jgi:hypothetical protein
LKFRVRPEKPEAAPPGEPNASAASGAGSGALSGDAGTSTPSAPPGEGNVAPKTSPLSGGGLADAQPRDGSGVSRIMDKSQIRPMNRTYITNSNVSVVNAARRQKRANIVRGLLIALAVPLTAASMYVFLAHQGDFRSFTPTTAPLPTAITPSPRQPAGTEVTPEIPGSKLQPALGLYLGTNTIPTPAQKNPDESGSDAQAPTQAPTETARVIELDWLGRNANGPYSLDADGNIVFTKAQLEERWKSLAEAAELPAQVDSLKSIQIPHPLGHRPGGEAFIADETFRLAIRRMNSNLEMQQIVKRLETQVTGKLASSSLTVPNLSLVDSSANQQLALENLGSVLDWTVLSRLTGEPRYATRAKIEVLAWARGYKPRGDALGEIRLAGLVKSYAILRDSFTTEEQKEVDNFLVDLIDKQFPLVRPRRRVDPWVLAHFSMGVHVSYATAHGGVARYVNNLAGEIAYRRTWGVRDLDDRELNGAVQILDSALVFDQSFLNNFRQDNDGRPLQFLVDRIRDELSVQLRVGQELKAPMWRAWLAASPFAPDLAQALTQSASAQDNVKLMAHIHLASARPDRVLMPVSPQLLQQMIPQQQAQSPTAPNVPNAQNRAQNLPPQAPAPNLPQRQPSQVQPQAPPVRR